MNTKKLLQTTQKRLFNPNLTLPLSPLQENSGGRKLLNKAATTFLIDGRDQKRKGWFESNAQANDNGAVQKTIFFKASKLMSFVAALGVFVLAGASYAPQSTTLPDQNAMYEMVDHKPMEVAMMLNAIQVGE